MKNYWLGFGSALLALLTLTLLLSYTDGRTSSNDDETGTPAEVQTDRQLPQIVKAIDLNDNLVLCNETLDMSSFDVRERLDRELLRNAYWHSSTLLALKHTRRYFPTIERILAEEGLPDDLKYLAVAESGLANAVSPVGARGIWQFMPATARGFDLEVTETVDERYHLEKATRAACTYLRGYFQKFDSWLLAMSAYNMGGGRLSSRIEEQNATDFFDLNLNQETSRYVFRIAAFKAIMTDPEAFGFYLDDEEYYPTLNNYREETVTSTVANLGEWAEERGVSYRMLKVYNPWLVDSRLAVGRGQEYVVKLPN